MDNASRRGPKAQNVKSEAELDAFVARCRAAPDEWFRFSEHASVSAARARLYQLRRTRRYADIPLRFRVESPKDRSEYTAYLKAAYDRSIASKRGMPVDHVYLLLLDQFSPEDTVRLLDAITEERDVVEFPPHLVKKVSV